LVRIASSTPNRWQFAVSPTRRRFVMQIDVITLQPLVALIFGILILMIPRLLNYLIAIYLIVVGLVGLWPRLFSTTTTVLLAISS
jgi:hypothetical protein